MLSCSLWVFHQFIYSCLQLSITARHSYAFRQTLLELLLVDKDRNRPNTQIETKATDLRPKCIEIQLVCIRVLEDFAEILRTGHTMVARSAKAKLDLHPGKSPRYQVLSALWN